MKYELNKGINTTKHELLHLQSQKRKGSKDIQKMDKKSAQTSAEVRPISIFKVTDCFKKNKQVP